MRRIRLIFAGVILLLAVASLAQQSLRDYAITDVSESISSDGTVLTLAVTVVNNGGDGINESDVNVVSTETGRVIASAALSAIPADETETVTVTIPLETFGDDVAEQSLRIEAGIDLYELAGTTIAGDNIQTITVLLSGGDSAPQSPDGGTAPFFSLNPDGSITVAGTTIAQDQIIIGVVVLVAAVILLWLLSVVLRLIFNRPRTPGSWQPPYSMVPTLDPDSTEGRRQAWQQHAQNGTIMAVPAENNVHPVKLLLSMDNRYLVNWKITAMRLSQYDSYGRVARSETVATKRTIRRLNQILANNHQYDEATLTRKVRPVTKRMIKAFSKKVKKRTAPLPIALDIRFEGNQGEVRIAFELYQCQRGAWHRIDRWEPMMAVMGSRLPENYTYTIHGMSGGETLREFRKRLRDDLEWLLKDALRNRDPRPATVEPPPQTYDVPDTLSGMEPISESQQMMRA